MEFYAILNILLSRLANPQTVNLGRRAKQKWRDY